MDGGTRLNPAGSLAVAASGRRYEKSGEGWTYGFAVEGYRRSPEACIQVAKETFVFFTPEAITRLEQATETLLRTSAVQQAWESEEFWGVVADLVATLPREEPEAARRAEIDRRLGHLRQSGPSLVAFPIANASWARGPLAIGDFVVGRADGQWREAIAAAAKGRPVLTKEDQLPWLSADTQSPPSHVAFAAWVPAFGARARTTALSLLDDVLGLVMLFHHDAASQNLFPLRGDSHRPGVRGLVIHRPALSGLASSGNDSLAGELAAQTFQASTLRRGLTVSWFGEPPFPLDDLLSLPKLTNVVRKLVAGSNPVHRRFLVASRWYSKAHWASERDDAVLALGIALDALLGDRSGLPSRALADRFALLEGDKSARPTRSRRFAALYGARSGVAHGGRPSEIGDFDFVREMFEAVRWAADQLLNLVTKTGTATDDQYAELFESLKWGMNNP